MDTSAVTDLLNDYYSIENTLTRRGFDIKGRLHLPVLEYDLPFVVDYKSGAEMPVRPIRVQLPAMPDYICLMLDGLLGKPVGHRAGNGNAAVQNLF